MKTILIPTDFSPSANNAARYGMHIARAIKANTLLCNAIIIPSEAPLAGTVVWPLETYDKLKEDADNELRFLAKRLQEREEDCTPAHDFHPKIEYETHVGNATKVIKDIYITKKPILTIMGMSGAGGVSRFFLGSNSKDLIKSAAFPVMLIPGDCIFTTVEKIGFATDLSDTDVEVVNSIARFAEYFNAEILLIHVTDGEITEDNAKKEVQDFLKKVCNKCNYSKIYYRNVINQNIDAGLDWISKHGRLNLLAMVHRNHSFIDDILKGSHTQRIARSIDIPLLVFPAGSLPVF